MQSTIYEVEQIGRGFLAVMAKPATSRSIEYEFVGIAKKRIRKVVSLLEQSEARDVGLDRERELCEINGMEFVSYPITDWGLPSSVTEFAEFTRSMHQQIANGTNTVVHCGAGIGRTGMLAAGILLHCGYEPDDAFRHISQARGAPVPDTDEQRNWIVGNHKEIVTIP